MHNFTYAIFFSLFASLLITARSRRRALAVAMTGVMIATLVIVPPLAQAQAGLIAAIQAVLSVINGVIQTALSAVNAARSAISKLYQNVAWPVQLISQAKAQVVQMIDQYRNLMANLLNLNLSSATLPASQSLEKLMRDHQINNFGTLTRSFGNTYGTIPASSDASPADRDMADMDDALTLDSLKMLKESDRSTDLELQAANSIETGASQAAPGSAPFLTATAMEASIRSQAMTQKMLAAELRQEAAHLAHQNGFRKRGAAFTTQLRGVIMNLLEHN
jgi:hypothetical protein